MGSLFLAKLSHSALLWFAGISPSLGTSPRGGIKVAFKFRGGSDLPWRPTDILSSALYGSSGLSSSFFELASYSNCSILFYII